MVRSILIKTTVLACLASLTLVACTEEPNAVRSTVPQETTPQGGDPVVVAVGDIAGCQSHGDEATAALLTTIDSTAVLALGDLA
jgi:hypothetical protein